MDHRGEEVENWQIDQNLQLLNDPEDQDTFYSRRWRTTSTPDLGFATDDIAKCTTCTVQDQLAGSDHRPIMLTVDLNMKRSMTQEENIGPFQYKLEDRTGLLKLEEGASHPNTQSRQAKEQREPISLTSCMCKLMERMINKRLVWYLQKHNILMDEQAGFRQFRSTEDQVAYIAQTIEDGYQKQQHTVTVWVDMEKAFDIVWKKCLILQMMQAGVSHNMLKLIQNYLSQRTGRVNLQGRGSRQAIFKDGVPQGGVLSPTLFLVFMNSIQNIIRPHVKAALYADDLALICSEDSCGTAQVRLQECLTLLEQWTDDWAMTINAAKTTYSILSLSTKIPNLRLRINNSLLEKENYPKYLGVTFDPRLTWCNQIETVQKNAVRRTLLLKKLSGQEQAGSRHETTEENICRLCPTCHGIRNCSMGNRFLDKFPKN
ncbi:RNA-directed DNA polymerase from mobile element jockey [Elysia marginata]|uniref:RNA-directed DNA polymerase from mobile element jockey n=1 Tax=Elysia marginata TaxID=1093978 RepID=A0AAV4J2I6_9GAST|nr:RNA-directed DNA polymerase from mobile element jockey [Elysia marginata]